MASDWYVHDPSLRSRSIADRETYFICILEWIMVNELPTREQLYPKTSIVHYNLQGFLYIII